jgi:arabinofuranan 3-O-arabinosyltransferase
MTGALPSMENQAAFRARILVLTVLVSACSLFLIGHAPIDLHVYWEAERALHNGRDPYQGTDFLYPPGALLLMYPLGWARWPAALSVATILVPIMVISTSAVTLRLVRTRRPLSLPVALVGLVLVSWPVWELVVLLNATALLALAWALVCLLVLRRHSIAAGVVLGVSLAVKPITAPFLVVLFLCGRKRTAGVAIGVAGLVSLGGLIAAPHSGALLTQALPLVVRGIRSSPSNLSLAALGRWLHFPGPVTLVMRTLALGLGAWTTWRLSQQGRRSDQRLIEAASVLYLAVLLAGPVFWPHYLALLLPAIALSGVPRGIWHGRPSWAAIAVSSEVGWVLANHHVPVMSSAMTIALTGLLAIAFVRCVRGYERKLPMPLVESTGAAERVKPVAPAPT